MNEQLTGMLATVGADEAARLLGVNKHTLYRWAREGTVPCIRIGKAVRFRVATLLEWMEQQERQSATKDS